MEHPSSAQPNLQNLLVPLSRKKTSVLLCSPQPEAQFPALALLTSSVDMLMEIKWSWMTITAWGIPCCNESTGTATAIAKEGLRSTFCDLQQPITPR